MPDVKVIVNRRPVNCGAVLIEGREYARVADVLQAVGVVGRSWDQATPTGSWTVVSAPPLLQDLSNGYASMAASWQRPLSQAKLDVLWAAAGRAGVDPWLMLAILAQEGTGSFDTSSANAVVGGNGPEDNWLLDVAKAVDLVAGKLAMYPLLRQQFEAACATVPVAGNALSYLNWATPIVRPGGSIEIQAPYARHSGWWHGVASFYAALGGDLTALQNVLPALSARWDSIAVPPVEFRLVTDNVALASDESGEKPAAAICAFPKLVH